MRVIRYMFAVSLNRMLDGAYVGGLAGRSVNGGGKEMGVSVQVCVAWLSGRGQVIPDDIYLSRAFIEDCDPLVVYFVKLRRVSTKVGNCGVKGGEHVKRKVYDHSPLRALVRWRCSRVG